MSSSPPWVVDFFLLTLLSSVSFTGVQLLDVVEPLGEQHLPPGEGHVRPVAVTPPQLHVQHQHELPLSRVVRRVRLRVVLHSSRHMTAQPQQAVRVHPARVEQREKLRARRRSHLQPNEPVASVNKVLRGRSLMRPPRRDV
eukprot:247243-Prorocentrum_minimum.AAC.2